MKISILSSLLFGVLSAGTVTCQMDPPEDFTLMSDNLYRNAAGEIYLPDGMTSGGGRRQLEPISRMLNGMVVVQDFPFPGKQATIMGERGFFYLPSHTVFQTNVFDAPKCSDSVNAVSLNLHFSRNALNGDAFVNFEVRINGIVVGTYLVTQDDGAGFVGTPDINPSIVFSIPPGTGTYVLKLTPINIVPPGQGSILFSGSGTATLGCGSDVHGDPHFITWGGEHFDFQGECDLVLIDNPDFNGGLGMHVHGRSKIHGDWSAFEALSVKIGDDVLEVHGEDPPLINGIESPFDVEDGNEFAFPVSMGGSYSLTVQQRGPHSRHFIIHLGDGEKIFVKNFKEYIDFAVESPRRSEFAGANGLLGSFSSAGMVGRDGKTTFTDPNDFGQEWQVRDTDAQLFHVKVGPQYPDKCDLPVELTAEQRMLRGTRNVTPDAAAEACLKAAKSLKADCIDDVLKADNIGMAGGYST